MSQQFKKMEKGELRIIKINRSAIEEMLWEHIMDNGERLLDLAAEQDEITFHMSIDWEAKELFFYASHISDNCALGFDIIDDYIKKNITITTNTLFKNNTEGKRIYNSIKTDLLTGDASNYCH